MKIAHECPLVISEQVAKVTSYNFYIATIAEQIPEYLDQAKKDTRFKILDCGTFEEGAPMEDSKYLEYIEMIRPSEYILPDFIGDKDATLDAARKWLATAKEYNITSSTIGVVQGRTLAERAACYKELLSLVDKIAFPYAMPSINSNYSYKLEENSKLLFKDNGRYELVNYLFNNNMFDISKKHHFLGIDTPLELLALKKNNPSIFKAIDTIDTSSPVLHGLKYIEYNSNYGILKKNEQMMKDLIMQKDVDSVSLHIIMKNIEIFKKICS